MSFKVTPKEQPTRYVSSQAGKRRPALTQPVQFDIELHDGPQDQESLRRMFGIGPLEQLERIATKCRAILRKRGLPERAAVITCGPKIRALTVKEARSDKWLDQVDRAITDRLNDGNRYIQITKAEWRYATDDDRQNPDVLVVPPSCLTKKFTVEDFAAQALEWAEVAIKAIHSGDVPAAVNSAMHAVDQHWRIYVAATEHATLAGMGQINQAREKADPREIEHRLAEMRQRFPNWGSTAIKREVAAEAARHNELGYSLSSLRNYKVPPRISRP